jgi:hypothetical protein
VQDFFSSQCNKKNILFVMLLTIKEITFAYA